MSMARTYVSRPISKEHHHSETLILWCSDPRLRGKVLEDFVAAGKFDPYDLICLPGGAKVLATPSIEGTIVGGYAQVLRGLHHFNVVVLTMHEDCGACGGSKAFDGDCQKEHEFLKGTLEKAKQAVLALSPEVRVVRAVVNFNGFDFLD